jgi:hypothetical protein
MAGIPYSSIFGEKSIFPSASINYKIFERPGTTLALRLLFRLDV